MHWAIYRYDYFFWLINSIFFRQPLLQKIDELIVDKYGRKVLLYLLTYRDSSHFRPSIVEALKEGDENESR